MIIVKSFLCISDARVRKILQSFSVNNKISLYSGTYKCNNLELFKVPEIDYNLLVRKNTIFCLIRTTFLDIKKIFFLTSNDTLYFVDEQLAITSFPLLLYLRLKNVNLVLDLFDSYYLKSNKNFFVCLLLKQLYKVFNTIIVTDDQRAKIMLPLIGDKKIAVIENFPFYNDFVIKRNDSKSKINLFFYGSLHESRGWDFISQFGNFKEFNIYLAGWDHFSDIKISMLPSNFIYLGLMNQTDTLNFMNNEIDWVFCLYEPSNINNINASPNKVYDAIHSKCGIIINSEVILSNFVLENGLGLVIDSYYDDASNYLTKLKYKNFNTLNTKEELFNYSFDKYLDFYKLM
jgi:hypothetical protein